MDVEFLIQLFFELAGASCISSSVALAHAAPPRLAVRRRDVVRRSSGYGDIARARARRELDKFATLDVHRCRACGVHAVGRVRRATGCAREMRVPTGWCPTGWCPCSREQKADFQLDGYKNNLNAKTFQISNQRLGV